MLISVKRMPDDIKDKEELTPNDFIVNGKESFAMLYNIFNRTKKQQKIQENQLKLLDNISQKMIELIGINIYNQDILKGILKEEQDGADEGKAIISNGILSATAFTIIDTQISPGHPVKGFTITNTDTVANGSNHIYVGMNISSQPQVDVDVVDVIKANPIFNEIVPNESFEFKFNRNKIKSIHLLAVTGAPTYKAWLVW